MSAGMYIRQNGNLIAAATVPGPRGSQGTVGPTGPTGPSGVQIVQHGTNGTYPRPTGATVVYWQGTARPTNALATDWWYNA